MRNSKTPENHQTKNEWEQFSVPDDIESINSRALKATASRGRRAMREYWSAESLRDRSLEEQYPEIPDETDEEYQDRIKYNELFTNEELDNQKNLIFAEAGAAHPRKEKETDVQYSKRLKRMTSSAVAAVESERPFHVGEEPPKKLSKNQAPFTPEIPAEFALRKFESAAVSAAEAARDPENANFIPNIAKLRSIHRLSNSNADRDHIIEFYNGPIDILSKSQRGVHFRTPRDLAFRQGIPENSTIYGLFSDVGESSYSEKDRRKVEKVRAELKEETANDEWRDPTLTGFRLEGKRFEGLFYPLVESGFFDVKLSPAQLDPNSRITSPKAARPELFDRLDFHAAFVPTSEYDDLFHATDVAAVIPVEVHDRAGRIDGVTSQLVAFDLTTADLLSPRGSQKLSGKLKTINREFNSTDKNRDSHGVTRLDYPSTINGKTFSAVDNIPHFVLALPRNGGEEMKSLKNSLFSNGKIPPEIAKLLNYEISVQAENWRCYWTDETEKLAPPENVGLSSPDAIEKYYGENLSAYRDFLTARTNARNFTELAAHFNRRFAAYNDSAENVASDHASALGFTALLHNLRNE